MKEFPENTPDIHYHYCEVKINSATALAIVGSFGIVGICLHRIFDTIMKSDKNMKLTHDNYKLKIDASALPAQP